MAELLADPESEASRERLGELFDSMVHRKALLRVPPAASESPGLRRYLDPVTNDRFTLPAPPGPHPPAPPGKRASEAASPVEASPPSRAAPARDPAPHASREAAPSARPPEAKVASTPRVVRPVEIVHPQPGVARRFLDETGEPLATFFSMIAARKSTDELADSFAPVRAQLIARTSATEARIFVLDAKGEALEPIPTREGASASARLLGNQVRELVLGAREILHVPDLSVPGAGDEPGVGALVSLPLTSGPHVAGILEVFRDAPGPFDREEIDLFALAAQVAAGCVVRAEHLERLIFVDKLTGLYNRAYFDDQIEREIERANRTGTSVALLMADLDHFKRINDAFGHQIGDRALAHLGAIMRANIRQIDVAARYGGEEFALLLPSITRARAVRTAERLRRVVADANFGEVIPELVGMKMSVSLGLALYPDDAATSKQLIDRADRVALYAAKNRGRNRVVSWASAREGTESLKSAG